MCVDSTRCLNELETYKAAFAAVGVEIVAISADSKAQLEEHQSRLEVSFPLADGLSDALRAGSYHQYPMRGTLDY
ncbi:MULTISPECIES: redoxin domain-containing protein [unclassified Vibrio]|uniref:redoxin domain-containing protein n=1 Tax=unclassified Vibrio TaxID=2614977 RepID=UPI001360F742|nr:MULTISPECIES: redoxin domain-containing protein [unclassified Vibrio]NAW58605.1 redoxin domain-containing protein [Vibrio sp. V36_P2S2PM302]NAX27489.1 redoxin domain-containing protein [Vibrio sp. V38_P2S17PM301]NAX30788.1 redoxin domain-containing protein [Vibrio sp. V37_P2S8PM304]